MVHEGCRKVLRENFSIGPVRDEAEGSHVTPPKASMRRPTGSPATWSASRPSAAPISHRGWQVLETRLPQLAAGHDLHILAPAEVEL